MHPFPFKPDGGLEDTNLQVHDYRLHQEEDDGIVLPVNVGGSLAELDTGNGCTLSELLGASVASQGLAQVIQEQLLLWQRKC